MGDLPPYTISIRLKETMQLFNSLDPSPFIERDLDNEAVEYIVETVTEHNLKRKIRIEIHLPQSQVNPKSIDNITQSIKNYFAYEVQVTKRQFKNKLNIGRKALIIGITFLVLCISLSELANTYFSGFISRILSEGLVIAGWVGMWRPISIFLYDWWPISRQRKIYEKIQDAPISVKAIKSG